MDYILIMEFCFRLDDGYNHNTSCTVTVSVNDLHDETPNITNPTNNTVFHTIENDQSGLNSTFYFAINATDLDFNETLTFAISSAIPASGLSKFYIDQTPLSVSHTNALIKVVGGQTLDYDIEPVYILAIG